MSVETASGGHVAETLDRVLTHIEAAGAACVSLEMTPHDSGSHGRDFVEITLPLGDRYDATNMAAVDELLRRLGSPGNSIQGYLEPHPNHPAVLIYGNRVISGEKRYGVLARRDRDPRQHPPLTTEVVDSIRPVTMFMAELDSGLHDAGFTNGLQVSHASIHIRGSLPATAVVRAVSDLPDYTTAVTNWLDRNAQPYTNAESSSSPVPSLEFAFHLGAVSTQLSLLKEYEAIS